MAKQLFKCDNVASEKNQIFIELATQIIKVPAKTSDDINIIKEVKSFKDIVNNALNLNPITMMHWIDVL